MTEDDVDSMISPGTEETMVRNSIDGQSREQQHLSFSETGWNEDTSHHENELHDGGL